MPSESDADVPADAAAVADRYRRLERLVTGAVTVLAAGTAGLAFSALTLGPAIAVAVVVLLGLRAPAFRSSGTVRLTTDADPDAVRADFGGLTPPMLAFQWGVADAVRPTDDGGRYTVTYLLGLRSVDVETAVRSHPDDADVEIVVTAGGRPWATYEVEIRAADGGTVVDAAWESDRRFGLRRLPQWFVAERYREEALSAQGYDVVERDARLTR